MSTSKTLSKEKEKLPQKTFEEIEAKELTTNEQKKISRSLILRWYASKKMAKLKGFQESLYNATFTEREEIKERIIKNTKLELAKHSNEIDQKELNKRVEAFAEEVMRVGEGIGSMDEVVAKYNMQKMEEDLFFKTLDTFSGTASVDDTLNKLFSTSIIAGLLKTMKTENPSAYEKIQKARKEANYEEMRKLIVESDPSGQLSAGKVDQFTALAATNDIPKFKVSIGGVYDFVTKTIDNLKTLGHGFAMKETSKNAKVPFMVVLKFQGKTFSEIKAIDNRLQKNVYLINSKTNKSVKDNSKIKFINDVHNLRVHIESHLSKGGSRLENEFKNALGAHLDKKEMDARDKLYIMQNASIADFRMLQLYELFNAKDQDRDRSWFRIFSRIPTMIRFHNKCFGENRDYVKMIREYHVKQTVNRAKRIFKNNAKNWKMGGILKEMDELENISKKWDPKIDQFKNDGIMSADEMLDHNAVVKKYQSLVKQATEIMTKEAKEAVGIGKSLDVLQNGRKGKFFTDSIESMRTSIGDDALKKMFPDMNMGDILKKNGSDLMSAYGKHAVDLKSMQDITRTRFSVLAETVDSNVAKPFAKKFAARKELFQGSAERHNLSKKLDNIEDLVSPTKGKYRLKRYGLPVILIGLQAYSTFQGKAKGREMAWDLFEAGAGFVPGLGFLLDGKAAITGSSLSGRKLGLKERALSGFFAGVGFLADAATVLTWGGGYAIRASIGGMRSATRTLKIAKTADNMKDMSAVADVGGVFGGFKKFGLGIGKLFSKAHRAEKATDAAVAAKAFEQTRLMAKLNIADDVTDFSKVVRTADNAKDIDKLRDLTKSTGMTINYKKVFEAHALGGKAMQIPSGILGRGWLKTKEKFMAMKKWFYKIGVPADVVNQYEKSFDALKVAQAKKLEALADLRKAESSRIAKIAIKEAELLEATKNLKGIDADFAKALSGKRGLVKDLSKAEHTRDVAKMRFEKLKKLDDVNPAELKTAKNEFKKATKTFDSVTGSVNNNADKLSKLRLEKGDNVRDFDKIESMSKEIETIEHNVAVAENGVRSAESAIYLANKTRSITEMEMIQKSEKVLQYSNSMRMAAGYMQKAGFAMGITMFLTGANPKEQLEFAGKTAKGGAKVAGYAGNKLFLEDHSRDALDVMIENRMGAFIRKKQFNNELQVAQGEGKNLYKIYAQNWADPYVREHAQRKGIDVSKINAWIAKIPGVESVKKAALVVKKKATGGVKEVMGAGKKLV